mgnify:CR=1 FL=1
MKQKIFIAGSALISLVVNLFGGWDTALETLILFMGIDWFTGGVLLPVVFKKSPKSKSGTLESRAGWKGLCRKGMVLLFVLIAVRLDLLMGTSYLRDTVCIAFIANEVVSIVENAGLMGIPLPAVIANAIDILTQKAEKKGDA